MPETCQKYVFDMYDIYLRNSEIRLRYICDISEICSRFTWPFSENFMRYTIYMLRYFWDLPETCQKYVFDTHDICLRYLSYVWDISEYMSVLDMTDIFLTYSWDVGKIWLRCALDLDMLFKIWIKCQWVTDWVSECVT